VVWVVVTVRDRKWVLAVWATLAVTPGINSLWKNYIPEANVHRTKKSSLLLLATNLL
jgi:hypothetical protein